MRERKHEPYYGLKDKMKRLGLKYRVVAATIDNSVILFCNKINGFSDFTHTETMKIKEAHGISPDDY